MAKDESAPKDGEWSIFDVPNDGTQQVGVYLSGQWFTLFYDYDETRDGKLSAATDDTVIRWFRERLAGVLLRPLSQLLDPQSAAFKALNSEQNEKMEHLQFSTFTGAAFSVLLNSIDALGFLVPEIKSSGQYAKPWAAKRTSGPRFKNFITTLMPEWDKRVVPPGTVSLTQECRDVISDQKIDFQMKNILWAAFRSAYTHMFRVIGVGYDIYLGSDRWKFVNGVLQVNPILFFQDFQAGVGSFFDDISAGGNADLRKFVLSQLRVLYPAKAS